MALKLLIKYKKNKKVGNILEYKLIKVFDVYKEVIIKANKSVLMHSSECESALCNCDGCCCYPVSAAKILGIEKQWPKKIHEINWNNDKLNKLCNRLKTKYIGGSFYE